MGVQQVTRVTWRRPVFEAVQWDPIGEWPSFVEQAEKVTFLDDEYELTCSNGDSLYPKAGDYIVTFEDGTRCSYTCDQFYKTFETIVPGG